MTSATYTPNGKGHAALERLTYGPATFAELAGAAGSPNLRRAQKRARYLLGRMHRDGFVAFAGALYTITATGMAAYHVLCTGEPVTTDSAPSSVRIFAVAA